MVNSVEDSQI